MKRLTSNEFIARFGKPNESVRAGDFDSPVVTGDARLDGSMRGDVRVRSGASLVVDGLIAGSLTVERDAIAWVSGLVDGPIVVHGAAYVAGAFGSLRGSSDAIVYDCTHPADGETGSNAGSERRD